MRIAQVAPLYESVPPTRYGGTERVVSWLTEELVAAGHDVTLFASADSRTSARLVPCCAQGLRASAVEDEVSPHVLALERALDPVRGFDVIHFHTGTLHLPLARRALTPTVTTMHGRLDLPELRAVLREFRDQPIVSISDEQRDPVRWAGFVRTVHHGMPPELFAPGDGGGGYLVFLGRISPEKRPDRAIEIARRAGLPLKIAAKVGDKDRLYFDRDIRPLLGRADVEFLGEVDDAGKQALLGGALGLLFPIDWPEPFGLAMIEALACGTPVIAWCAGSVPSIVDDGETGRVVSSIEEAVDAVDQLRFLSRAHCRAAFEERFTSRRMAEDYLQIYAALIAGGAHVLGSWSAT